MIFIAKGTTRLGVNKIRNGEVVEETQATFTIDEDGGSVGIGDIDPETMKIKELSAIFGDWDAAGYLQMVMELLKPSRKPNLPPLREIVKAGASSYGDCPFLDWCPKCSCRDCCVREWIDENEED